MIYQKGTVSIKSGEVKLIGNKTNWTSNKAGIAAGQLITISTPTGAFFNVVKSVNSDTEITLAFAAVISVEEGNYVISTTLPDTVSDGVRKISATNAYLVQLIQNLSDWQSGSGEIEITMPDGEVITVIAWRDMSQALADVDFEHLKLVIEQMKKETVQSKSYAESSQASSALSAKSATTADDCAKKACECATKASYSETNAKASEESSLATSKKSAKEADRAKKEADRAESAAESAVGGAIPKTALVGELGDNPRLIVNQDALTKEIKRINENAITKKELEQAIDTTVENNILGIKQLWVDPYDRFADTTYTNSHTYPIAVCIAVKANSGGKTTSYAVVDGGTILSAQSSSNGAYHSHFFIVSPMSEYSLAFEPMDRPGEIEGWNEYLKSK